MPLSPNDITFTLNLVTDKTGKLLDIKVSTVFMMDQSEPDSMRPIEKELQKTLKIFGADTIEFTDGDKENPTKKVYKFNTNHVTVQMFIDAIVDFEKIARPKTLHRHSGLHFFNHVFYEGVHLVNDGTYFISWGS